METIESKQSLISLKFPEIEKLFNEEVARNITYSKPSDFIFNNTLFYDIHHNLSRRLGIFYEKLICLFDDFEKINEPTFRRADIISHSRKIILELKTNYSSANADMKSSKFFSLCLLKQRNPTYEVIFGCVNDSNKPKQYYNKDGVLILTGDKLLEYLFGAEYYKLKDFLKHLMFNYLKNQSITKPIVFKPNDELLKNIKKINMENYNYDNKKCLTFP
jgi:hypothetical protein